MKNQLVKWLTVTTPLVMINCFCSPANADAGMVAAQGAINMTSTIINNSVNASMNARNRKDSNDEPDGNSNRRVSASRMATGATFNRDPAITREIQQEFVSKAKTASEKKFMTLYLTPENAENVFGSIIKTNSMVDAYALASLLSFALIEDKLGRSLSRESISNTNRLFAKQFITPAPLFSYETLQRRTERMLYWSMLIGYYNNSAKKGNANPEAMAMVKANASKMMTSIGLSPQKYTLSDRGITEK